jgi:superfamily II DNA/RNA helicase
MTVSLDAFSDPSLPAADNDEFYDLYKAALEWRLASPIVIRSAEDIVSAERWKDRVMPFHHQVRNLIAFCRLAPAVLLADEVGLGKTISAGLILSELIARRRVARALVVCPRVLCDQWVRELNDKFRLEAMTSTGAELVTAALGETQVVVTTYETVRDYFSDEAMPTDAFQMLILDEAHRLRNLHGPNGPPRFASQIRDVIESRWFTYVLMLTATPVQNRFTDIYSLIDLLTLARGHQNPFGNLENFRTRYLLRGHDGRRLQPNMASQFRQTLNNYVARTRRVDADLPFPSRNVNTVRVEPTQGEREFEKVVGRVLGELNPLAQSSLGQALMSSPSALAAQLENMSAGRPHLAAVAAHVRSVAERATPAKLTRLFSICDELRNARTDWRVVVFTRRLETQEMIRSGLLARGTPVGLIAGGRAAENQRDTASFVADPPRVHVLVSTDAGAEGVNLQEANVLVNYDMPWNPMILEQRIGRIQRLGSRHRSVQVMNLVAAGTVEESVVARLMQRLITVTETVGDLESILAGVDNGADDGSSERFETIVRDLVVRSLQGQDVRRAAELQAASIDRAKQEYDANCVQINQDLGTLDASAIAVGSPPRFERPPPLMSAEDFARRALSAEGHQLREVRPGLFQDLGVRGSNTFVALSPHAAELPGTNAVVSSYIPGLPAFERLAERWSSRRSHRVLDLRRETDTAAERVARQWCENYPGVKFLSCLVRLRKSFINGRVLVRTTAENRVDQHQRLIEHPAQPEGHKLPPSNAVSVAPVLRREVTLQEVSSSSVRRVRRAIAEDQEVNAFTTYYNGRRINELSKAGPNPHLRQRVEDDFSVTVEAEVVGFSGACYDEAIIDIKFDVEGQEYAATLQAIPVFGQIIEKPTEDRCPLSGLRMPYDVLARCERTGRLFPRHLLLESELSRRLALRDHTLLCDVTGKLVIDDEVEVCSVTQRRAVSAEFVTCAHTGQRILKSESGTSAVSGVIVRRDLLRPSERSPYRMGLETELICCEVSKRWLLTDEVGTSAVSGCVVDRAALVASERSGRLGLENETVRCQVTERLLLQDEVGICSITSKKVDSTLLGHSEQSGRAALKEYLGQCSVTGKLALHEELEKCVLTGSLALQDQIETCSVSGLRVIRRKMAVCEITNAWLSPSAAAYSDLSRRAVRPDLLVRSERPPHRAGLPDEIGVCEISGKRLLMDEMAHSVVSNRLIDRSLLTGSIDRLAHPSELVTCEVSGRRLLPSETNRCELTKKVVDRHLLVRSELSGRLILSTQGARCAVTNKLAALDELGICSLSGLRVLLTELETCAVTGVVARKSKMVKCSETDVWLVPDAAGRSDYRPRWVNKKLLYKSKKLQGRMGTKDEFGACEVTKMVLLLDELQKSDVSEKLVDRELLRQSEVSGRFALPEELMRCEESHRLCLPSETEICSVTRKRVLIELLDRHNSGRLCLKRLLVSCPLTSRRLFQDETEVCTLTGLRVAASSLAACAITGKRAIPDKLQRCSDSGQRVIPSEIGYSDYRSRPVKKSLLLRSAKPPGRLGTKNEFGICEVSGKSLLLDELARCSVTNQLVDIELLVTCGVSNKRVLKRETLRCPWLGQQVIKRYLEACELTSVVVAKSFLDENRMLRPLAEMLDGDGPTNAIRRDDLIPRLKKIDEKLFAEVVAVHAVNSPGGDKLALCATILERGWFKTRKRYAGFLLTLGSEPRIIGDLVVGDRERQEWKLIRTESYT